jgi:hypothetical protein
MGSKVRVFMCFALYRVVDALVRCFYFAVILRAQGQCRRRRVRPAPLQSRHQPRPHLLRGFFSPTNAAVSRQRALWEQP